MTELIAQETAQPSKQGAPVAPLSRRGKAGQSCPDLPWDSDHVVPPLRTRSTRPGLDATSREKGLLRETEAVLQEHVTGGSWDGAAAAHLFPGLAEISASLCRGDKFSSENRSASLAKLRFPQRYLCFQEQVVSGRINSLSARPSAKIIIILLISTRLAFTNAKEPQSFP